MPQSSLLLFITTLLLSSTPTLCSLEPRAPQANCDECAPNPIASLYPNNGTGTINATTSVIIVPLSYALSLLPAQLVPLPHAYTRFSIPPTHYPLVVENTIEHDFRYQGINAIADFSSLRFTFPFIDLLGDNSTCFRYTSYIYLPPTVPLAIAGAEVDGIIPIPATFDPANAAYRFSSAAMNSFVFSVYPNSSQTAGKPPAAEVFFKPTSKDPIHSLDFYRNVTNQPFFGNKTAVCEILIRFWNTSLSEGANQPENVEGIVKLGPPLVAKESVFRGVKGIRATQAFLENSNIPCEDFRGYRGTGEGDSG